MIVSSSAALAIKAQIKNERDLIALHNISGLSVEEVIEKVKGLPYSLEYIFSYYAFKGKFPE